jgi:DNA-binding NarL/FixJ family response regulator
MSAPPLATAVTATLDSATGEPGLSRALELIRTELSVARLSLHSVDRGSFRVVAGSGEELLASGTQLPVEASSQIDGPAEGRVFRAVGFDEGGFDRPLDRLVLDLGYRSGCSLPLMLGSRTVGVLCVTAREAELDCDALLGALDTVSTPITLALVGPPPAPAQPHVMVCLEDELLAEGIARVLEQTLGVSAQICADAAATLHHLPEKADAIVCDSFFAEGQLPRFLRELRGRGISAPTLVIAATDSPLSRNLARLAGAVGYLARDVEAPGAICAAVVRLLANDAPGLPVAVEDQPEVHLTSQESRVLLALERGLRFKQIAAELSISDATAKSYARALFAKLGAHSRSEAVYAARRLGMLDFLRAGGGPARSAPKVDHVCLEGLEDSEQTVATATGIDNHECGSSERRGICNE